MESAGYQVTLACRDVPGPSQVILTLEGNTGHNCREGRALVADTETVTL